MRASAVRALAMVAVSLFLIATTNGPGPHAGSESPPERVSHGRFEGVALYRPVGDVRQVVLFLSGDEGWNAETERLAKTLVGEGAFVVGIRTPPLLRSFSAEGGECVYPDGDLENLSHWIQGYAHLPTYFPPLLVGYASGGTLAYAALARAPAGTFSGALSLAFCPHLAMDLPVCGLAQVKSAARTRGHGIDLAPSADLKAQWIVLQGEAQQVCPASSVAAFVSRTRHATMVRVPRLGHTLPTTGRGMRQFLAAYRALAKTTASIAPPPAALVDLPLIEVGADGDDARFAVLLSGDGGWAGLDEAVAAALAARGISVVGWDSLRYFWTPRTPASLADDLDRVLKFYAATWHRSKAIVIGYSQGADVLPFALNRLPASTRALVARTVLLNLGERASFEFHVGNWIGNDDTDGLPIRPEAEKLPGATTFCIYGEEETTSLCPRLGAAVRPLMLPGGHHFDGDYERLTDAIIAHSAEGSPGEGTLHDGES